jgi:sugar/nucleoside kinase (ribokinase family)
MLDLLGPAAGPGRTHAPVQVRAGGTAVTAALAASATGADVTVVGRVGADPAAAAIRFALDQAGVDARLAIDTELPTGTYVELGKTVVASRGANANLEPGDLGDLEADAVLISGYLLTHDGTLPAARVALEAGVRWRAVTATPLADTLFLERAENANVLFVNDDEADRLQTDGFEIVCVTHGAAGATVTRDGRVEHVPPTGMTGTGAGDAFAGAFLALLSR